MLALATSQFRHPKVTVGHTLHSSTLLCLVSGTPCNASHYYSAACFFRLVNPTLRPSRSFMPLPHAACLPASVPTRSRPAGRRDYTRLPQKVVPAVPAPTLPSHRWCQLRCTPPSSVHVPAASPPPQVAAEAEPRTLRESRTSRPHREKGYLECWKPQSVWDTLTYAKGTLGELVQMRRLEAGLAQSRLSLCSGAAGAIGDKASKERAPQ